MAEFVDFPFYECAAAAEKLVTEGGGKVNIHQKFSCSKCGARQTMEEPNKFFKTGRCEECGHMTNIEKQGCNYLVHAHDAAGVMHLLTGDTDE